MNISSLLCSEDPPPEPRVVPEPVVLAPHLVRQQSQQQSQAPKLNLEALVHAADQERRRLDSHHPSHPSHSLPHYPHPARDIERERERDWARADRDRQHREREKGQDHVAQREWEREREQRQILIHQHQQKQHSQQQSQHPQQQQQQQSHAQQKYDQGHDRFFRQREQRQVHRESILGYQSRPEPTSPRSHIPSIPLFDQQPTLRASASPKIANLLASGSSPIHVPRLPLSHSPPYPAADMISHQHPSSYSHSIPSDDEVDRDRSSKKRRHSDSIAQQVRYHEPDVDRLNKERELMTSSGLGYGRGHRPSPSLSSDTVKLPITSRKPGSSGYNYDPVHDQDAPLPLPLKRLAVEATDEKDRERPKHSIGFLTGGIQGNSRDHHHHHHPPQPPAPSQPPTKEHRVVSPAGRRSPPGSHVGRALAARHHDTSIIQNTTVLIPSNPVKLERRESALPTTPIPPTAPSPSFIKAQSSEPKEKDKPAEKKKGRSRTSNEVVVRQEELIHKASRPSPAPSITTTHLSAPPPRRSSRPEDDAHEWFLEQFDDDTAPPRRSRTPSVRPSSPPPPPVLSQPSTFKRHSKSPFVPKRQSSSPVQDAVMALEQELEDIDGGKPQEDPTDDMDVDQVVTELVEETLGGDEEEGKHMEVDVEDELLSLLDDKPAPSSTSVPVARRDTPQSTHDAKSSKPSSSTMKNTSRPESPSVTSPSFQSPRAPSPRQTSDRDSMPPPAAPVVKEPGKGKKNEDKAAAASQPKKKGKPGPKPKPRNPDGTIAGAPPPPAPKPRGKPGPKPKPRDRDGNIIRSPVPPAASPATGAGTGTGTGKTSSSKPSVTATPTPNTVPSRSVSVSQHARSRSTSALPGGPEGEGSKTGEVSGESDGVNDDDNKLYCVCKTRYDEDKSMIACDSCDEWYHTQCVDMPDHQVDLVDQFVCPLCIAKNPELNLKTTYKARCLYGLLQPDPDSPKACHKPARTYSKYCSDECGVKKVTKSVEMFVRRGGNKAHLWESVKNAEKREGLIRCVEESTDAEGNVNGKPLIKEVKPKRSLKEKEVDRLNSLLDDIAKIREELKKGMEIIAWREQLIGLATDRARRVEECGWDQRLCFADEEWAEHGELVLESYKENEDKMETDGQQGEDAVWWCNGDEHCHRHAGWQALRTKDVNKEKEKKTDAINKLTSKEREIRRHIESLIDIEDDSAPPEPLKSSNKQHHGTTTKRKVNGESAAASKKGKKRKAPS
ncbi:COMPASS (complex proteins associated with Set1p) component [Marasmius crinis-equi]|uniref:COMPASS (Complex proteins associated with Set1p) component n=1 Tax=Marasmius crinis-equi TaxID=585013 RepID=A0ABR3FXY3_9AGAR